MSDETIQSVEHWLLSVLNKNTPIPPAKLLMMAESTSPFSPSDITWTLWYMVGERKLEVTPDHLIAAVA